MIICDVFFFFSSRRRHTRCGRDWSSDVCSSDLGISRGFDGIEENFMDVATPEMRKEYLRLYKLTIRQACNIEKTINNWWKDTSIVDEEITGPIDEQELLNYLEDRKSTRLNSSHVRISYAVFCLKK